jgi:hypothetical protein
MSSKIATAADGIVTAINAATLSQEIEAERRYIPGVDLDKLDDGEILVLVVPPSADFAPLTRRRHQIDIPIDIGVIKKLQPTTNPEDTTGNSEIDALIQLCEEIEAVFDPGTYGGAAWVSTRYEPIVDPDYLRNSNAFVGRIIVTVKTSTS